MMPVDDKIVYQAIDSIIQEPIDRSARKAKVVDYVHGLDIPIREEYKLWMFMDYFNKKIQQGRE